MNLKQLRAFVEVVNTGSVSEAARRLHRSQPAISAVIANLESELGINLFIRQGMRLKPAPEANFLLKEANEILLKVDNVQRTMENVRQLTKGTLEIASMPGPSVLFLPTMVAGFSSKHSDTKVTILTKSSREVEQTISAQNSDLGFADFELLRDPHSPLVSHEIYDFECFCAMGQDDPLAKQKVITPTDLHNKPMATLYATHPTNRQTLKAFNEADATMNPRFEAQYFVSLLTYVEQGLAYSIIDRLTMESYFLQKTKKEREIVFRQFRPCIQLRTTIMTPNHRPASMLAQSFLTQLRESLATIQSTLLD